MPSTYEEYLTMPMSLTFEEMAALHRQIAAETDGDTEALDLYKDLLAAAVKYAESRARWPLWDREKRMEEDPVRTSRHNQVVLALDMLARYLQMQGKPALWRDTLGEEAQNPYCRKRLGDFACYLAFAESLNAR